MIQTEKFYLFDVGVTNYLAKSVPRIGSREFGKSFEQFILMEIRAYQAYKNQDLEIRFWRTAHGQEIDFIVGEKDLAIEIKASKHVQARDIKSFDILAEDGPVRKKVVVDLEEQPRKVGQDIHILPWTIFIEKLWAGELV